MALVRRRGLDLVTLVGRCASGASIGSVGGANGVRFRTTLTSAGVAGVAGRADGRDDARRETRSSGVTPYSSVRTFAKNTAGDTAKAGEGKDKNVLDNLLRTHDVILLHEELEASARQRDTMALDELRELVRNSASPPRSPAETAEKLQLLQDSGMILVLEDLVYLRPREVTSAVLRALPGVPSKVYGMKQNELEEMQQEFEALRNNYDQAQRRAESRSRMIISSGLVLLCCQLAMFVRLTYYEFSWDVMEPISYFVGLSNAIMAYSYYLWNRRDFTFESWQRQLEGKYSEDILRSRGFNLERYIILARRLRKH